MQMPYKMQKCHVTMLHRFNREQRHHQTGDIKMQNMLLPSLGGFSRLFPGVILHSGNAILLYVGHIVTHPQTFVI